MNKQKSELIKFFNWLKKGFAFCLSWFLLIILVLANLFNHSVITIEFLNKLIIAIIGGVFIFCFIFTNLFIKKWLFVRRLTIFLILISIYEIIIFYWIGYFNQPATFIQILIFISIILILYFINLAIYHRYSKKQGELYTQSLHQYQQKIKGNS